MTGNTQRSEWGKSMALKTFKRTLAGIKFCMAPHDLANTLTLRWPFQALPLLPLNIHSDAVRMKGIFLQRICTGWRNNREWKALKEEIWLKIKKVVEKWAIKTHSDNCTTLFKPIFRVFSLLSSPISKGFLLLHKDSLKHRFPAMTNL